MPTRRSITTAALSVGAAAGLACLFRANHSLLWGERDTFGPPSLGEEMAALMPDARCEVIPDAGHLPWLDDASLCAERVRSFVG
jgi:hypothetical protein